MLELGNFYFTFCNTRGSRLFSNIIQTTDVDSHKTKKILFACGCVETDLVSETGEGYGWELSSRGWCNAGINHTAVDVIKFKPPLFVDGCAETDLLSETDGLRITGCGFGLSSGGCCNASNRRLISGE